MLPSAPPHEVGCVTVPFTGDGVAFTVILKLSVAVPPFPSSVLISMVAVPVKAEVGVKIAPSRALLIFARVALTFLVIPTAAEMSFVMVNPSPESSRSSVPFVTVIEISCVSSSESATVGAIEPESVRVEPSQTTCVAGTVTTGSLLPVPIVTTVFLVKVVAHEFGNIL